MRGYTGFGSVKADLSAAVLSCIPDVRTLKQPRRHPLLPARVSLVHTSVVWKWATQRCCSLTVCGIRLARHARDLLRMAAVSRPGPRIPSGLKPINTELRAGLDDLASRNEGEALRLRSPDHDCFDDGLTTVSAACHSTIKSEPTPPRSSAIWTTKLADAKGPRDREASM